MPEQQYSLQITFHYNNGEKESFLVTESATQADPYPELRESIQKKLNQQWCLIHTAEETIYINMTNVDNVSIKPPLGENNGEIAFTEAQRITALTRKQKVL